MYCRCFFSVAQGLWPYPVVTSNNLFSFHSYLLHISRITISHPYHFKLELGKDSFASLVSACSGEPEFKVKMVKLGVECTCFFCLFHLVCFWVISQTCAKLESILTLQSLTKHYFLCKDTIVHIYYVENTSGNKKIFF